MDLKALPTGHPLRNKGLASIGAQYRLSPERAKALPRMRINGELEPIEKPRWHTVKPTWKIATNTFNQLGPTWVESQNWRAKP
jgi:hypothetical protein